MNDQPKKCAWCGRWLNRPADYQPPEGLLISHGICPACVAKQLQFKTVAKVSG